MTDLCTSRISLTSSCSLHVLGTPPRRASIMLSAEYKEISAAHDICLPSRATYIPKADDLESSPVGLTYMEFQIITCVPFASNFRVFFTFSPFQQILIPYHLQELMFHDTHCSFLYAEMTAIF